MNLILPFEQITENDRRRVGGKGYALSLMAKTGVTVPSGVCITADAYRRYVTITGLGDRIRLELSRKQFTDMRWEEIWDAALRIRNMFLTTPLPQPLAQALRDPILERFGGTAVVVRSSSPDEDSSRASFAGLHESYVNIRGAGAIMDHVRLVWASLWSDAALLYRRELGLDVRTSSMAVVVQEIVSGERSGVAFSRDPNNDSRAVIEAVYGLNQGLVDGSIEPDRWHLDRTSGRIISSVPAVRENHIVAHESGVAVEPLMPALRNRPPLEEDEVHEVYRLLMMAEEFFGSAQDVEWTIRGNELYLLQSRPITTTGDRGEDDRRPWYLSLRRSFENLRRLRSRIEGEILPAMTAAAGEMSEKDLAGMSRQELRSEVIRRVHIYNSWVAVYWKDLIPFAHGIRLFGMSYNDALKPEDPYEFMDLLAETAMEGVERNRMLREMAALAGRQFARDGILKEELAADNRFQDLLQKFMVRFGDLSCGTKQCAQGPDAIIDLVVELASVSGKREQPVQKDLTALTESFLRHFEGQERVHAEELLDLARAS